MPIYRAERPTSVRVFQPRQTTQQNILSCVDGSARRARLTPRGLPTGSPARPSAVFGTVGLGGTQPWTHDASAVAEPVSPHTLPLGATPVGSAPESDLPPLDATQISLLEAPAGAPLRPMQAAAPHPREESAAVAATEAAEAAKRLSLAAIVSPSLLPEERVIRPMLQLASDIRRPHHYIGYSAFICFCLSRECRAYFWEGGDTIDVLHPYAPWAIRRRTRICVVD